MPSSSLCRYYIYVYISTHRQTFKNKTKIHLQKNKKKPLKDNVTDCGGRKQPCKARAVLLNYPNAVPFNTVPHAVVTPTVELFSLLHHNYNFATIMNCNVNI